MSHRFSGHKTRNVAARQMGHVIGSKSGLPPGMLPSLDNLAYLFTMDSDQTTNTTSTDASANARSMSLVNTPTQVAAGGPGMPGFRRYFSEDVRQNQYSALHSVRPSISGFTVPEDPIVVNSGINSPRTWTGVVNCSTFALYGYILAAAYLQGGVHPNPIGYYIYIPFVGGSPSLQMRVSQHLDSGSIQDFQWALPNGADGLDHTVVIVKHPSLTSSYFETYWDGVSLGRITVPLGGSPEGFEFFSDPAMCISNVTTLSTSDGMLGQDFTLWTTEFTAAQALFVQTMFLANVRMKKYLGL